METSGNGSDPYANSSSSPRNLTNTSINGGGGGGDGGFGNNSGRNLEIWQFPTGNFFRSPLSFVLEYSGLLPSSSRRESDAGEVNDGGSAPDSPPRSPVPCAGTSGGVDSGEVSIRIIGVGEQEESSNSGRGQLGEGGLDEDGGSMRSRGGMSELDDQPNSARSDVSSGERTPLVPSSPSVDRSGSGRVEAVDDSSYQSYDIQQIAKWVEQVLPFSLLLLVVFIRQHLQGFFVTIWISAFLYKSNDTVRKQTALKGERKVYVLVGIFVAFMLHIVAIYWWYRNDDLLYPLIMLPPKAIPPFWHALFIILVNDTMVRQAAMAFKCLLLIYYKNGRGHNFRRQGQMLTLLEYTLLLYRVLLPTPVWYCFFLNKEYGSLFSSLITGLYLTFKLTSVIEKVQHFLTSLRALSRKDIHFGSNATLEQVNAAGDLCAICQEKMQSPILLRCNHIFCEDCVSEWFDRERTCPLCRALVKPPDIRTFGDGSTNLLFQLF
ncbi:hypothetical protein UlMin_026249 [Ulmus minor]